MGVISEIVLGNLMGKAHALGRAVAGAGSGAKRIGVRYSFCSGTCAALFDAEPARYAAPAAEHA